MDFTDRFAAAAADGFKAVEYLFPYAVPGAELAGRLRQHGLTQALFNAPPGDWDAGERGMACLPGPRGTSSAAASSTGAAYARRWAARACM
jgi:hydroxypyruvate isomerase